MRKIHRPLIEKAQEPDYSLINRINLWFLRSLFFFLSVYSLLYWDLLDLPGFLKNKVQIFVQFYSFSILRVRPKHQRISF